MKEISVEEKAMRYDDRLKRAQKWYVCNTNEGFRSIFEDIFPEFKESMDENIRNGIKILIDRSVEDGSAIAPGFNITKEEAIAWLEKKGEEKPQVYETEDGEVITYSESKGYEVVEPKFKVGDWIIYEDNIWKICILNLNTYYELLSINNETIIRHIEGVDKTAHLWTIKDAKEGDVLVTKNKNIFIFKTINGNTVWDYCGWYFGKFWLSSATVNGSCAPYLPTDYVPATKEQCDFLFQQMKEEGYEWDANRKELKQLEPNSAWSEKDEEMIKYFNELLNYAFKNWTKFEGNAVNATNWLEVLKERIGGKL